MDSADAPLAEFYKNNALIDRITFQLIRNIGGSLQTQFEIELRDCKIVELWLDFEGSYGVVYQVVEKYLLAYADIIIRDRNYSNDVIIPWSY